MPPRLPYPPHHPPMLRRAAAAAASASATGPAVAQRRGRLLQRARAHAHNNHHHNHNHNHNNNTHALAADQQHQHANRFLMRHPAWQYHAPAVRGMPVMFEEQVDWQTPYDHANQAAGAQSARRRMTGTRRRFSRLAEFLAMRMVRRGFDGDEGEVDSLGLTYEELLELDDRNVRCGMSKGELSELGAFEAEKEHMNQVCHICLEGVEYGVVLVELECAHVYHKSCIHTWLKEKRSCPTCRSEL